MVLNETQRLTMEMAKAGYESYAAHTGNKPVVTGENLPRWENLPETVLYAWFAAAEGMTIFLSKVGDVEVVNEKFESN